MNKLPLRAHGERGLTEFFAREQFLDYVEGTMDEGSRSELERLLSENVQLRLQLERFEDAVQMATRLRDVQLKDESLQSVLEAPSNLETFAKSLHLHRWPPGLRWGLEAIFVIAFITTGALFFPWGFFIKPSKQDVITLAELSGDAKQRLSEIPLDNALPSGAVEKFEDELAKPSAGNNTTSTKESKDSKVVAATPTPAAESKAPPTPPAIPSPTPTSPGLPSAAALQKTAGEKSTGFLYRGTLQVRNLDATSGKFVEFITNLGGRKAGEVDLGWVKGSTRYFHFTIPEAKYADFEKFSAEYGKPSIAKEPHPRRMPDGIVRIILVLSERGG